MIVKSTSGYFALTPTVGFHQIGCLNVDDIPLIRRLGIALKPQAGKMSTGTGIRFSQGRTAAVGVMYQKAGNSLPTTVRLAVTLVLKSVR